MIELSAVFIITYILVYSDGPYLLLYKLRAYTSKFGLFDCFPCLSLWVSLIVCLISGQWLLLFPIWAGAVILDAIMIFFKK